MRDRPPACRYCGECAWATASTLGDCECEACDLARGDPCPRCDQRRDDREIFAVIKPAEQVVGVGGDPVDRFIGQPWDRGPGRNSGHPNPRGWQALAGFQ